MTVAELIRELQALPNQHAPVRLILSRVWVPDGMVGFRPFEPTVEGDDDLEADEVRNEGAFVLVRSK